MRLASIFFVALNLISQSIQPLPWSGAPSRAIPQDTRILFESDVPLKLPFLTGSRKVEVTEDGTLGIIDQSNQIIWRGSLPGRRLKSWLGAGTPLSFEELKDLRFPESTPDRTIFSKDKDPRADLDHLLWFIDDGESYLTCLNPVTLKIMYLKLPNVREPQIIFAPTGILLSAFDKQWLIPWIDLTTDIKDLNTPSPQNPLGTAFKPFPNAESQGFKKTRSTPFEDRPKPRDE